MDLRHFVDRYSDYGLQHMEPLVFRCYSHSLSSTHSTARLQLKEELQRLIFSALLVETALLNCTTQMDKRRINNTREYLTTTYNKWRPCSCPPREFRLSGAVKRVSTWANGWENGKGWKLRANCSINGLQLLWKSAYWTEPETILSLASEAEENFVFHGA